MKVGRSRVHKGGMGVFGRVNIPDSTIVCLYTGKLFSGKKLDEEWVAGVVDDYGVEWGIDSEDPVNESGR